MSTPIPAGVLAAVVALDHQSEQLDNSVRVLLVRGTELEHRLDITELWLEQGLLQHLHSISFLCT